MDWHLSPSYDSWKCSVPDDDLPEDLDEKDYMSDYGDCDIPEQDIIDYNLLEGK